MITIKKFVLILMSTVILLYPLMMFQQQDAEAAIVSKIGSAAAKKAAKEVIKDSAVQMAMDIVFNYEMNDIMKNGYRVDDGYTPLCMEKVGDKCTKPMQAKVPNTKAEKKVLADKVDEVLDRKANMSGWKKFLDWFIPIFLLGTAGAWIESQFDSDSKGLFDDVAKESLEETRFIKEMPLLDPTNVEDADGNPVSQPTPQPWVAGQRYVSGLNEPISVEVTWSNEPSVEKVVLFNSIMSSLNSMVLLEFSSNSPAGWVERFTINDTSSESSGYQMNWRPGNGTFSMAVKGTFLEGYSHSWTSRARAQDIIVNGESYVYPSGVSWNDFSIPNNRQITQVALGGKRKDGKYYAQGYMSTNGGNRATFLGVEGKDIINPTMVLRDVRITASNTTGYTTKAKITVIPNASTIDLSPYKPNLKEYPQLTIDNSGYVTDDTVLIPPPTAIPIKTPEGLPVKPDGTGGWIDLEGNTVPVNEDTLIVEDLVPTPDEDGHIAPDGTVIPKPNDPTDPPGPTDPDDDTPDKDKSKKELEDKSREWGPLLTTRFPFSLPWDFMHLMGLLYSDPVAPRWELEGTEKIPLNIVIDLSFLDPYIKFFRGFVFFSFVAATIFMHGRFMGGSK